MLAVGDAGRNKINKSFLLECFFLVYIEALIMETIRKISVVKYYFN